MAHRLRGFALSRRSGNPEYFARQERKRARPSVTTAAWLALRNRNTILAPWLAQVPANGVVLDVGGAIQPYRRLISNQNYIGLDLWRTPRVNVVADAVRLPIRDNSIDAVICTGVLQSTDDPQAAVGEMSRVLKPRGLMILGVASLAPNLGPKDRWRFDFSELHKLLDGLHDIDIVPECATVATFFTLSLHRFARTKFWWGLAMKPIIVLLNLLALIAEKTTLPNYNYTLSFAVRARKPPH
jgi:SAM-dependent methyltransferase